MTPPKPLDRDGQDLAVRVHVVGTRDGAARVVEQVRASLVVTRVSAWVPSTTPIGGRQGRVTLDVALPVVDSGQHHGRGLCRSCGQEYALRRSDGTIRNHDVYTGQGGPMRRCPGGQCPPVDGTALPVLPRRAAVPPSGPAGDPDE